MVVTGLGHMVRRCFSVCGTWSWSRVRVCGRMANVLISAGGGACAHSQSFSLGEAACRYVKQVGLELVASLLHLPLKC